MLSTILQKELWELSRSRRIRLGALVFWVLGLVAIGNGHQHYATYAALHQGAQAESYHQWLNQGEKNPHSGAHFGVYVFKPIPTLAAWDKGVDDYYGVSLWLEPHKQSNIQYKPIQDQNSLARFANLWPAVVFNLLAPLLVLLLAYNSVNKEILTGAWGILRSAGLGAEYLVTGKLLAIWTATALLTLPMFALAQGVIAAQVGWDTYQLQWPNVGLLLLAYVLYYGLWGAGGLLLSALFKTEAGALTAGLVAWMLVAVLLPRSAAVVAQEKVALPSAFAFYRGVKQDLRDGIDGSGKAAERKARFEQAVLTQYAVNSLEALPLNFAGLALQDSENFSYRIFDKHYQGVDAHLLSQNQWVMGLSAASPSLAMGLVCQAMSGSGLASNLAFSQQAEAHRRLIQTIVNEEYAQMSVGNNRKVIAGKELWAKVPSFRFQALSFSAAWQSIQFAAGVLLAWFLLLVLATYTYAIHALNQAQDA
ncbi:MAG: DUF3526 domain-containing protein [Lewinella sp.]|nr:DUF3526 domain-containing protein [Lewinella sp.]